MHRLFGVDRVLRVRRADRVTSMTELVTARDIDVPNDRPVPVQV